MKNEHLARWQKRWNQRYLDLSYRHVFLASRNSFTM